MPFMSFLSLLSMSVSCADLVSIWPTSVGDQCSPFDVVHSGWTAWLCRDRKILILGSDKSEVGPLMTTSAFGRSRPAADASREVEERWLLYGLW